MDYAPTFGIETHAQLLTASKMFCSCRTDYTAAPPNSLVCPVCLGMPGSLPVINRRAVECVIMTGLALHCQVAEVSRFDRKNYNYPDLVKGYQISQYDLPLCRDGWLEVQSGPNRVPGPADREAGEHQAHPIGRAHRANPTNPANPAKNAGRSPAKDAGCSSDSENVGRFSGGGTEYRVRRIGIHDVHLEEDTGKLVHVAGQSLVDFNRSGVPLMEIVSEPDFTTIDEVREYVLKLRRILRYLGVSSGNMEEGAMRFEANVSLHPAGSSEKGTRVEVKNLNSFRALLRSLEFEVGRQESVLREGGAIHRETRGWDDVHGVTFVQRGKETADDYRYFPEPDLPHLEIAREWVQQIRSAMPELPDERYARFMFAYGLSPYDAHLLTDERPVADYFEQAVAAGQPAGVDPKAIANWITGELFHLLHDQNLEISAVQVPAEHLVQLVALLQEGKVTMSTAKHVLGIMFKTGNAASEVVAEEGLLQIKDAGRLAAMVDEVIATEVDAVTQYLSGKESVLRFLVGQVMKATNGKADPNLAADLIKHKLS
jgi:aspartyl-tRNA(Asn)/glutamyl-tRNA(Gln) amidotransferase subunit B